MKATITNYAATVGVSLIVVISVFSFSAAYQSHAVIKGVRERNLVESVDQLEFIKMGMEQSAVYSTDQASYNVSKYGTYKNGQYGIFGKCDMKQIDKTLFNNIPKDLPYWKVFSNACFTTNPSEIEFIIKSQLETETSGRFNEYIDAIKKEYDITIPAYASTVQIMNDAIATDMTTEDEIKFESELLKISNKLSKISKTVKLPLKRLIDYSVDKFVILDPFSQEIQNADQAMSTVTIHSLTKPEFVNNNLNDGELTDRTTNSCKSLGYKICINPLLTPDGAYTYPTKLELLPTSCKSDFERKVNQNIDALDSRFTTPDTVASIKPEFVKADVDSDETPPKCQTGYAQNFDDCDCVKWGCTGDTPVVFGTTDRTLTLPSTTEITTQSCSECVGITGSTCTQFVDIECLNPFSARDVDDDGTIEREECVQIFDKECPLDFPLKVGGQCFQERVPGCNNPISPCTFNQVSCGTNSFCFEEAQGGPSCVSCSPGFFNCDFVQGCESTTPCDPCLTGPVPKQCLVGKPHGSECWGSTTSKACPSDAPHEFGTTGRCYKELKAPTCILHKTLYTKACSYDYLAEVASSVNLKDKENNFANKYPVYDSVEQKTDFKNLELQFYVLSKN